MTGGAGFVGGNLVVALAGRHPEWEIVALDNLMRRGSELSLPRLQKIVMPNGKEMFLYGR